MAGTERPAEFRGVETEVPGSGTFRYRLSAESLQLCVVAIDVAISMVAMVAGVVAFDTRTLSDLARLADTAMVGLSATVLFVMCMGVLGGYRVHDLRTVDRQISLVARSWIGVFFLLGWAAFLLKSTAEFSRGAITIWFAVGFVGLCASHWLIARWLRKALERSDLALRRVHAIVIGDGGSRENINGALARLGVEIVGSTVIPARKLGRTEFSSACVAAVEDVSRTTAGHPCDAVYLFAPWQHMRAIDELRNVLCATPLPVVLFADRETRRVVRRLHVRMGGFDGFEVQRAPLSRIERGTKRALDVAVASTALLLLMPVMLVTAAAIVIESGRPVLFKQYRKGVGGRRFEILKFRSMTTLDNGPVVQQASRNDARVTVVGQTIRAKSIDELPQLINVLRGDMSIVGPRPHAVAHDDYYDQRISSYAFRHHVKPGITGWAQINGYRGETKDVASMEARIEHDLWYINNWSIWLDIKIIVLTAFKVLHDRNAF